MKLAGVKRPRKTLKSIKQLVREKASVVRRTDYSKQKCLTTEADASLNHLLVPAPAIDNIAKWAPATSYNNAVLDATKVKCYICGAPGHFIEVCPLYADLDTRFGMHGARASIWGRAIAIMKEKTNRGA